jgi:hypothetical protein
MDVFRRRFALVSFVAFKPASSSPLVFCVSRPHITIYQITKDPRSRVGACKIVPCRLMPRLPIALSTGNMGLQSFVHLPLLLRHKSWNKAIDLIGSSHSRLPHFSDALYPCWTEVDACDCVGILLMGGIVV